jgi:hypothetical protein
VLISEDGLPQTTNEIFDADGTDPAINGGGDIRFSSDSAGSSRLACEVVSFVIDNNPALGTCQIWVEVPSISSSSDTTIYIWWGKDGESQPAEDAAYGKEDTWDDGGNQYFVAVHHLEESAGNAIDSTANDNDGTFNGTLPNKTSCKIESGQTFTPASSDHIFLGTSASLDAMDDGTVECWHNMDAIDDGDANGWWGADNGIADRLYLKDRDTADPDYLRFTNNIDNINTSTNGTNQVLNDGVWNYSATRVTSGGTWYVRHNKVNEITATNGKDWSDLNDGFDFFIGSGTDGGAQYFYDGLIDELRISNIARSVAWCDACYENQNDPGAFVVEGASEAVSSGGASSGDNLDVQLIISKPVIVEEVELDAEDLKCTFAADPAVLVQSG